MCLWAPRPGVPDFGGLGWSGRRRRSGRFRLIVAEGRDLHRAAFAAGEDLKVVAQVSDGSSAPSAQRGSSRMPSVWGWAGPTKPTRHISGSPPREKQVLGLLGESRGKHRDRAYPRHSPQTRAGACSEHRPQTRCALPAGGDRDGVHRRRARLAAQRDREASMTDQHLAAARVRSFHAAAHASRTAAGADLSGSLRGW